MKVKPTDKKYFCFGCGEKGDAIDFVAKYYNQSPREAAMQIADEFGIIYDSYNGKEDKIGYQCGCYGK